MAQCIHGMEQAFCTHCKNSPVKVSLADRSVFSYGGQARILAVVENTDFLLEKRQLEMLPLDAVLTIPIKRIRTFDGQPRQHFDKKGLHALAMSLSVVGQHVPVIVVWLPNDQEYFCELVDGERRLQAAEIAGLPSLRAVRIEVADKAEQFARSAVANFGRIGHTALEIADALQRLRKDDPKKWTLQMIADAFGKSIGWVQQHLALEKLDPLVREMMNPSRPSNQRITFSVAMVLASLSRELQIQFAQEILQQGLKTTQALQYIRGEARASGVSAGSSTRGPDDDFQILNRAIGALEDRSQVLGNIDPAELERILRNRSLETRTEVLARMRRIQAQLFLVTQRFAHSIQTVHSSTPSNDPLEDASS